MGLSGAAHALAEKSDNRTLGAVSREIAEAAGQGRRPTTVLQRHPGVFPAFARAVIETGEETGLLEQTCKKMAEFYDQMYELQLAYRAQGFYPALLLAAYVVIPAVPALVLDGFGAFAVMVISSTWHTALFLIALLLVWRALVQFRGCAEAIDRLKLSLPWLGSVFRRTALSRWARAMAMLFSAGVAMGKAVETAASACGNAAIEAAIRREASGILKGQPLSEVMKATGEFPNTAVEMVAVGEQSGEVDKVLARLAGYYETEVMAAQKQAAVSVGAGFYLLVVFLIGIYVIRFWTGYYGQLPRPGT
jgi:type II secretory pathway component PulF